MRFRLWLRPASVVLAAISTLSAMAGGCMVGPNYTRPVVEQPLQFKSQAASEAAPPIPHGLVATLSRRGSRSAHRERPCARTRPSGRPWPASTRPGRSPALPAAISTRPSRPIPGSRARATPGTATARSRASECSRGVTVNDWLIPVDLTYEVDVWGRVRRSLRIRQGPGRGERRRSGRGPAHARDGCGPVLLQLCARWTPRRKS